MYANGTVLVKKRPIQFRTKGPWATSLTRENTKEDLDFVNVFS